MKRVDRIASSLSARVCELTRQGHSAGAILAMLPEAKPRTVGVLASKYRKVFGLEHIKPDTRAINLPMPLFRALQTYADARPQSYNSPTELATRILAIVLQDGLIDALFEDDAAAHRKAEPTAKSMAT